MMFRWFKRQSSRLLGQSKCHQQQVAERLLVKHEVACLEHLLKDIFGYYLAVIGGLRGYQEALKCSRVRSRYRIAQVVHQDDISCPEFQIQAREDALPINSDTLDAVVLPHTLELVDAPTTVIKELERAMVGDGRMVILGCHPLSLWGMRFIWWRWRGQLPKTGRVLLPLEVIRALHHYGFAVEFFEYYYLPEYTELSPLVQRGKWWTWSRMLARVNGIYAMRAIKLRYPLTRVLQPQRALRYQGGVAQALSRTGSHREQS